MSDRITSGMIAGSTLADINNSLSMLQRSESELASGKTIQEPSDNPYGASRAIELQSSIDGMSAYEANAQDGISWTQTASSALNNVNEVGQRVHELLIQASNDVNNPIDRTAIAEEVEQLTNTVKQDANTQYAGQYIFSGTLTNTPPYKAGAQDEYQGNAGTITRVLGKGQESGDGKLLDTLRTITEHLRGATPADVEALGTTDLKNLEGNLSSLLTVQAGVGAVTDQMQTAASRMEDLKDTATQTLSNTEDADLAKVTTEYSNEQAAFNAALRAGASIVQQSLLEFLQ